MSAYLLSVVTLTAVFSFAALSLNLQYGLTGLVNFGQVAFIGVGAYGVGVAVFHGYAWWIGALVAPVAGGALGLLFALVARRLRQDYWAVMTLGVAALIPVLLQNAPRFAGGTGGIYGIPAPFGEWTFLWILVALIVVILAAFERIRRSQFGRVLRAIREDPVIVESVGKDIARYELAVMVIGGAVAAFSGVAYALYISYIDPTAFTLDETFVVWTALIVGGVGNNLGALIGTAVIQGILAGILFLPGSGEVQAIMGVVIEGALLVTMMILRPQGLIPEPRRTFMQPSFFERAGVLVRASWRAP